MEISSRDDDDARDDGDIEFEFCKSSLLCYIQTISKKKLQVRIKKLLIAFYFTFFAFSSSSQH